MDNFYKLICILLILKLHSVMLETSDCLENEFENEQRKCIPCKQCGAGYELSEDCGSGRETQCLPCRPGRYKEDRGHHHCLRCLNCAVINRSLKANCSLTSNSICGDCLPGFYSKTRIGGFRELECFPCTAHTPRTESQCYPKFGPEQPTSTTTTTPLPRDPVLLVAVIMVTLSLILVTFVTFSVICCGRFLKSQLYRGSPGRSQILTACAPPWDLGPWSPQVLRQKIAVCVEYGIPPLVLAFRRSRDFVGQPDLSDEGRMECVNSPREEQQIPSCCFGSTGISEQVQGQLEDVNGISKGATSNSCTVSTAFCPLPPSGETYAIPPPPVKSHYSHSVSEIQPLILNSGCSDCFSACGDSAESNQSVVEPLPAQINSCASEKQHWSHAPVECTELDLENFSSEDASQAPSRINKSHQTCSCTKPATSSTSTEDEWIHYRSSAKGQHPFFASLQKENGDARKAPYGP
ncbi:tumor necrosis factor receptor superfamily member 27-like isoform 2-T3 [Anomaloglossus baeobatrachus]|uniref:tumor necrosis factor receptor superfamily member 27-like isoform X2 n=1 Tax=Anomaloglossus baeobatrachus TaxID=238106 RepID=UPI003F502910